eukprot:Nk52_evm15s343 gene=Nk52_evmTU15s343
MNNQYSYSQNNHCESHPGVRPCTGFDDEEIFLGSSPRKPEETIPLPYGKGKGKATEYQSANNMEEAGLNGNYSLHQEGLSSEGEQDHCEYYSDVKEHGSLMCGKGRPIIAEESTDDRGEVNSIKLETNVIQSDGQEYGDRNSMTVNQKEAQIKEEAARMDGIINKQIDALRKKIESADKALALSRKKFEEEEVRYVAAKLDFEMKTVEKDELTEDLRMLIQKSESQKVRRMSQLMEQLNMVNANVLPMANSSAKYRGITENSGSSFSASEKSEPNLIDTM